MKRPLLIVAISYVIGIIIGVYLQISIPLIVVLLLISVAGTILRKKYCKIILIITLTILISCSQIIYLNNKYEKVSEYSKYENVKLVGTICSQIKETDYKYIVNVKLDKNIKVILQIKKDEDELKKLVYGNKIIFTGKYEIPTDRRNYKGFSYKEYLRTKGIYGIVQVEGKIKVIKQKNINLFQLEINNLSLKIKQNLEKILSKQTIGLAKGILLGDSSELEEDVKENFRDCNLSHMLAVSGMHVSYLILGINFILNKNIIGTRNCKMISILVIIVFMIITNMSPSVVRAGISVIIGILGTLIYRKQDTYTTISFAALLTLIKNPFSMFDIGMQLSYLATISIVTFYTMFKKKEEKQGKLKKYIKESLLVTISANILILPLTIYNFNTIPTNFILSNLIAGPILGISIILELITVFLSFISLDISKIFGMLLNWCLYLLIRITEAISKIPNITVITPKIGTIIFMYLAILLITIHLKNKLILEKIKIKILKGLKIAVLLIAICYILSFINIKKELKIHFVDVGQGDCTLICSPTGKNILVDGGGNQNADKYDVGEKVLLPYLLDRRIKKLDYVIISHFDSDHVRRNINNIRKIKSRESYYI